MKKCTYREGNICHIAKLDPRDKQLANIVNDKVCSTCKERRENLPCPEIRLKNTSIMRVGEAEKSNLRLLDVSFYCNLTQELLETLDYCNKNCPYYPKAKSKK